MLEATTNYGPFKKGQDYRVLEEKVDWCRVLTKGKVVYTPRWVFYGEI